MSLKEISESMSPEKVLAQSTDLVKEYPVSSLLTVFGVGLGVGVLLSQTVCHSMLRAFEPEPTVAERLSRQIYDAVRHAIPDSIANRFHA